MKSDFTTLDGLVLGLYFLLVLVIGFGFHFVGQLISLLDWDLAMRLGLQEADAPPEFQIYERATAVADVAIGWVYGVNTLMWALEADTSSPPRVETLPATRPCPSTRR